MLAMIEEVAPILPQDRPRYLMGVGTPEDMLEAVARGIDMFDCVMPTRNGRHGMAFTRFGQINLRNARHADDPRPLDEESAWPSTRDCARAYLHHLVRSGETLGAMLLSEINIAYYQQLMPDIRDGDLERNICGFSRAHARRLGARRHRAALNSHRRASCRANRVTGELLHRVLGDKAVAAGIAGPEIADDVVAGRRRLRPRPWNRRKQGRSADHTRAGRRWTRRST